MRQRGWASRELERRSAENGVKEFESNWKGTGGQGRSF